MKISKYVFFVTFIFNLAATTLLAGVYHVEVAGSGSTRQEAIYAGLIEAVRQVNGVEIASKTRTAFQFKEFSTSTEGKEHNSSLAKSSVEKDILSRTKGVIQKYDIITAKETKDQWETKLSVFISKYEPFVPNNRRKIAIMPVRTLKNSYHFSGHQISAQEISRQFTQKLVTELTQSRRFKVLDREYLDEYAREKNLFLSADTPIAEQMRLGEVLGVDYMLVGVITDMQLERTAYQINTLGKTGYRDKATFIADYRIIVMATRQVKWADSISLTMGTKELRQLAENMAPQAIQQALIQKAAQLIAHRALANIYPIRIAQIQSNGTLIFNQGGNTISEGELFNIFTAGEKVVDPYSGESLGAEETWVATAKIERILAKMSYASIIKGDSANIQKGDICRRVSANQRESNGLKKKTKKLTVPW